MADLCSERERQSRLGKLKEVLGALHRNGDYATGTLRIRDRAFGVASLLI